MKTLSVTSVRVGTDEPARRRTRRRRLSPPGAEVVPEHDGQDAPGRSAAKDEARASTASVTKAPAAAAEKASALRTPDRAAAVTPHGAGLPPVGTPPPTTTLLAVTGRVSGAVTRDRIIGGAPAERFEDHGPADYIEDDGPGPWFTGATALGPGFGAIPGTRRRNEAGRGALDGCAARGMTAVINGCSAVDTDATHAVKLLGPADRALRLPAAGARA
ncbi:aspartate/glutamate racemase family protein [Streptomyces sp. NPDC003393]